MKLLYTDNLATAYQPDTYQPSVDQFYGMNEGLEDYLQSDFKDEGFNSYYQYNPEQIQQDLNLEQQQGLVDQITEYGDDLFDLFDQYKPQYEYIAQNAGVSGAELNQRLADSGARYSANADGMEAEANRALQRMGVNPNSGRYAAMKTGNSLSKAAGYSANQNQVRQQARDEDMNERMQAAQMGLGLSNQGMNAYGNAINSYASMGQQLTNEKYKYDALNEQARQFNVQANQSKVGQIAGLQNQFYGQASDRWKNGMVETLELTPGMGITDSKIGSAY
ncbi:hypothetical protein [Kistimonas asteriae]|uniref:hypothetical protein n=1 Tax=Kistimonas asteriae TaxID=517724 RepID=UPI001BA4449A|nr:hypothetical protein [Kistimonas asteriae]